jgi:hypothetical protein
MLFDPDLAALPLVVFLAAFLDDDPPEVELVESLVLYVEPCRVLESVSSVGVTS